MIRQFFSFMFAVFIGVVVANGFNEYLTETKLRSGKGRDRPKINQPDEMALPDEPPDAPQYAARPAHASVPSRPARAPAEIATPRSSRIADKSSMPAPGSRTDLIANAINALSTAVRDSGIADRAPWAVRIEDIKDIEYKAGRASARPETTAVGAIRPPPDTIIVHADTPSATRLELDRELVDQAPAKLTSLLGNAFLVVHTPDTFDIPAGWRGADVSTAALNDTMWVHHGSINSGWAISTAGGKRSLVPRAVLAQIVLRIEEKLRARPDPIYRVDVILNSSDIVDVHVEYF